MLIQQFSAIEIQICWRISEKQKILDFYLNLVQKQESL